MFILVMVRLGCIEAITDVPSSHWRLITMQDLHLNVPDFTIEGIELLLQFLIGVRPQPAQDFISSHNELFMLLLEGFKLLSGLWCVFWHARVTRITGV
jgi:hypothetical protein